MFPAQVVFLRGDVDGHRGHQICLSVGLPRGKDILTLPSHPTRAKGPNY